MVLKKLRPSFTQRTATEDDGDDASETDETPDAPGDGGSRFGGLKKTLGVAVAATVVLVSFRKLRRRRRE